MSTYNGEQASEGASLTQEQEDALQAASYITVNDPSVTLSSVDGVASYTVGSDPIAGRTNSAYAQQHYQYLTGTSKYARLTTLGYSVEGVTITDGGGTGFGYLKNVGAGQVDLSCDNADITGVSDLNEVNLTSINCTGDADFVDIDATESVTVGTVLSADNTAQEVQGTRFTQTALSGADPAPPVNSQSLTTKHYVDTMVTTPSPSMGLFNAGTQSIPGLLATAMTYDSEDWNINPAKISYNAGVITVADPGVYAISYEVRFNEIVAGNSSGTERISYVVVNGDSSATARRYGRVRLTANAVNNGSTEFSASTAIKLDAGDTVSLLVLHDFALGGVSTPLLVGGTDPFTYNEFVIMRIA